MDPPTKPDTPPATPVEGNVVSFFVLLVFFLGFCLIFNSMFHETWLFLLTLFGLPVHAG